MNDTIYKVRDWDKHFENSRTRQLDSLHWVPVPNKHDGEGFRTIMAQKNGMTIYAAWHLILQVASKCHPRGTLMKSDGTPMSPKVISIKTGASEVDIETAIRFLSTQIDWLERVTSSHTSAMPPECHPSDARVTPECHPPIIEGKGREGNERNGIEEMVTADTLALEVEHAAGAAPASKMTDDEWLSSLTSNPAYAGLDVMKLYQRMVTWCEVNNKKPSRRRFVNWINREEKPMTASARKDPRSIGMDKYPDQSARIQAIVDKENGR